MDGGQSQIYGLGGQQGSRLNDVKPEDIESIEVVKGPAAATLYGSDAVAGVINIITKKGRPGSGFTQTINMEYGQSNPNFTPPDNWGKCTASALNRLDRYPNCAGRAVDEIIHDNPLERTNAFLKGTYRNLNWSLAGGGDNYGVFFSLGADDDQGTLPNNQYGHVNSRARFDFMAREDLTIEFGFGLARVNTQLPRNDNDIYGYLGGGLLGDPRTLGGAKDGWYAPNRAAMAISSYENTNKTWRIQPRTSVKYSPFDWFTNTLTVGGDMQRSEAMSFWAKNDDGWWDAAPMNTGRVSQSRNAEDRFTMDYIGTFRGDITDDLRVDLSVGAQALTRRSDGTNAQGTGLVNNTVRSINSAAELTGGGQSSSQSRDIGVFSQADISWRERLYVQLGVRRDQSSTFGIDSKPFYSPKIGMSYVISDEDYFRNLTGFLPEGAIAELRLRGAFGVSGRQPGSGARSTYGTSTNQISDNAVAIGVRPGTTGNPSLRAEKSRELELGFDAGLLNDRLGLQFTYFHKQGIDQILELPVAPSVGAGGPDVNVGEILTSGIEVASDFRLLTRPNLAWEVRASANTMNNEVIDLGGVPESTSRKVGFPLNGAWEYTIYDVDVANNRVTVSDTLEFQSNGTDYPSWETAFSTTLTLFQSLTFYAQADGRGDYYVYDNTNQFRDRQMGTGESIVKGCAAFGTDASGACTEQATAKYLRRYGPFYTESGSAVSRGSVDGAYGQIVNSFKLREASVSYRIPSRWVQQYARARSASVTVTMRNLKMWTNFLGMDPESLNFLAVPQDKRWTVRFNVTF
ncbi:MAG: TonB-dependent receptor [Longimicrobiales bacterium]|nr:TonB-dependent receptor [Longimicrobiales bacterium]